VSEVDKITIEYPANAGGRSERNEREQQLVVEGVERTFWWVLTRPCGRSGEEA
jgi:hypothetical protein